MTFIISKEQLEKIASYLASKPWVEVQALMKIIQELKRNEDGTATQ